MNTHARTSRSRRLSLALILTTTAATLSGCLFDSRWGEREREQRRNAARLAPSALQGAPAAPSEEATPATGASEAAPALAPAPQTAPARTFRIRIYVTPQYAAQVADAKQQLREMVSDANLILAPTTGARLDIESVVVWETAKSEDDLQASLEAIKAKDAGGDVDWVVAMVGGMPKATLSFHDIGRAFVLGKHLAMRSSSRLGEHDAIEKAFDELGDDERAKLRRALKRHRASAVFLHEIGHTLGALHENDAHSIMHPSYDQQMTAFGADAAALMRITVSHRAAHETDASNLARDLLAYLEPSTSTAWLAHDHDELVKTLRAALPAARGASGATARGGAPASALPADIGEKATGTAVEGVRPGDQEAYAKTVRALASNDVVAAWTSGKALFTAYPDVLAVQDLRCQVAMRSQSDFSYTRSECARLMELSTAPPPKKTKYPSK